METFALPPGFLAGKPDPAHRKTADETSPLSICFEDSGDNSKPVVVVLGGISAHCHVYANDTNPEPGWWSSTVGPGQAVDTHRFRLLSFDYLGGNGASSGPRLNGLPFPTVSTVDQAHCLSLLLDHLGIDSVHGIVGALLRRYGSAGLRRQLP